MNLKHSFFALSVLALILLLLRVVFGSGLFNGILYVGIVVGLLSTVVSLFAGLGVMTFGAATKDQKTQAKWTTLLMRSRVFAQGMTLICGVLLLINRGDSFGGL